MKAYNNLDIFDPKRSFTPWVYTIARNLAKNAIRDRRYFRDISLEKAISEDKTIRLKDVISDPKATPDLIAEDEELNEQAQIVLNTMQLKYREVITLCSIQGLTYKEAAKIIGCSTATVTIRLNRAKILFMQQLGINTKG